MTAPTTPLAPDVQPAAGYAGDISPEQAWAWVQSGEAELVDVRTDAERARDVWRNPAETLAFFDVANNETVVEIWPGGGWYTNILAPLLGSGGGTLVAAGFDTFAHVMKGTGHGIAPDGLGAALGFLKTYLPK